MYRWNAVVFVKGQTLFVYVIASLRAFLPIEIHCYIICINERELLLFIYDHDFSFHMFIYEINHNNDCGNDNWVLKIRGVTLHVSPNVITKCKNLLGNHGLIIVC